MHARIRMKFIASVCSLLFMYIRKTVISIIFSSIHWPASSCVTFIANRRHILSVEHGEESPKWDFNWGEPEQDPPRALYGWSLCSDVCHPYIHPVNFWCTCLLQFSMQWCAYRFVNTSQLCVHVVLVTHLDKLAQLSGTWCHVWAKAHLSPGCLKQQ